MRWVWSSARVLGVKGCLYVDFAAEEEHETLEWLVLELADGISYERYEDIDAILDAARATISERMGGPPTSVEGGSLQWADSWLKASSPDRSDLALFRFTVELWRHRDDRESSITEGEVTIGLTFRAPTEMKPLARRVRTAKNKADG